MIVLPRQEARRIAVRAQLLTRSFSGDLPALVEHLTLLQYDQTSAVAPSADLVAWSRLGSSYHPSQLAEALEDRTFIELKGMIRPYADISLYKARMAAWDDPDDQFSHPKAHAFVAANPECRRDILSRLDNGGPLPQSELPDTCKVAWGSSGWNNNRNLTIMLECLAARGEIAIADRDGREKLWDLAHRVYPSEIIPEPAARRIRDERLLRSQGLLRARPGFEAGEKATVKGLRGTWRVDPAQLDQPFAGRTALLSPLDRLIFDRKRMLDLFEFDYALEMYKPAHARKWGYWAMPILRGDRLIGKLDATTDRRTNTFRVDAIHEDAPFTPATHTAVLRELRDLAAWLGLDLDLPDDL
ncbi:crosslink repair DNA glycosylase YcaQ family protein [Actinoplanes sp. NPDC049596]|uniref:DNA glycosylase AlkZ-like family protein n=1 Tax=unclassified Actinoplanes TaxID=2626549 RepID=UPI00342EBD6D